MKKDIIILSFLLGVLISNCSHELPMISYESRISITCIEGRIHGACVNTGSEILVGKDGIKFTDKKFRFKRGIKALLIKTRFNYGNCGNQFGTCEFDQIVNYPIKLEYLRVKKDTMEITDVENGIIKYAINNKSLIIPKNDSLSTLESKIDTVYDRNKERIILNKDYITTIKYSETLDLKTMKYIRERKHT